VSYLDGCALPKDVCTRPGVTWDNKVQAFADHVQNPRKLYFPDKSKGNMLFTTGQVVRFFNPETWKWNRARIRGKVRHKNRWCYALKYNKEHLDGVVEGSQIIPIRDYNIFEDSVMLQIVGGPRKFRDSYCCSPEEYKTVVETWKKHKKREADEIDDLLANALGPLGASEESMQSFKKWLKDEDVDIDDLGGVKVVKDIDGWFEKRESKRRRKPRSPSSPDLVGKSAPKTRKRRSAETARTESVWATKAGARRRSAGSKKERARAGSKTPSRVWPPKPRSRTPSRVWPPTRRTTSVFRRSDCSLGRNELLAGAPVQNKVYNV